MRIEAVCTGDELLTGLTTDSNSTFFTGRVFDLLGQKVERVVVVGDVRDHIVAALKEASSRADAVLVSGGLGPTADDFTVECAAALQGVELVEHGPALEALRARFASRGLTLTANNARQARVPQGAEVVLNPVGAAPMFIQRVGRCTLFYVPGVPREYRHLVEQEVLPRLRAALEREGGRVHRAFALLKTVGLPESHLDARVAPLLPVHPKVVFGFRTQAPENHLKLMAEGASQAEADQALAAALAECRPLLAPHLFAEGDQSLEGRVVEVLLARGETVAVAESCTGGQVSDLLSAPPGASGCFRGGAVVYQEGLKQAWAGVSAETLAQHGAVSSQTAEALALGIRARADATWGLGITGYAGPTGGTEADPVGTVYFALAGPEGVHGERHVMMGGRQRVRRAAAAAAVDLLRRQLDSKGSLR